MGCLKEQFYASYGYPLNVQKLGFRNLASLLTLKPGVRVYKSHIMPSDSAPTASGCENHGTNASHTVSNSDGELSDSVEIDDGNDYLWEELGPICVNSSNESGAKSKSKQKAIELKTEVHPEYGPSLSNDDSESEGDNSCLNKLKMQGKPKSGEKDGSVLQILSSWYGSKDSGDSTTESDETTKGQSDSSTITQSKHVMGNSKKKKINQESYSCVGSLDLEKEKKIIDGVLDSLNKISNQSDQMKMQS